MSGEIKAPLLCLKAGVKRALYMNERKELKTAPVIKDGDILIPREALAIAGIEIKDDYASSRELRGLHKVYEGMGLIFLDGDKDFPTFDTERDIKDILAIAHSFIFEVTVGDLSVNYAPATEKEREDFVKLGEEVRGMLLARNNTHPFIMGSQDILDRLREVYTSDEETDTKDILVKIVAEADKYLREIPALNETGDGFAEEFPASGFGESEYDVGGRHSNSESHLNRVAYVALAYHLTQDEKYARVAYYASLAVIGRKHWGPGHFLNCSGATGALARIYDWLYNAWWSLNLDTAPIKRGIYDQGLHHGYNSVVYDKCDFPSPKQCTGWRFKLKNDNWNSVCNSGMILGSLCLLAEGADEVISEEEYAKITELLGGCITSTMHPRLVFNQYAPDGSYVESNAYWAYGTSNLATSMAALYSSLGTDLGLHHACGFDKTCYYAINTESADFVGWNYHDGGLSSQDTSFFDALAIISGDHALMAIRRANLKRGKAVSWRDAMFNPEVRGITPPELSALSLDYAMIGIDAFTVRSGWESGSLYAGMIGGINPEGASHNQLDSGAFVYHNLGKLWFTDLGGDYYNSRGIKNGLGYFSNYGLYRRNADGNNVLALRSLDYGQLLAGRGVMYEYKSSNTASYAAIDNKSVYGEDKVEYARRGMLLTNNRRTLVIKDEVGFTSEDSAFTTAHFESDKITAEVSEDGMRATLTHNDGQKIFITLLGDGKLELMDCTEGLLKETSPAEGEHSRENYKKLVVRHDGVKKINTSFVIDTEENSEYTENTDIETWKTL